MDIAATQYLLGIHARLEGLEIDPWIPGWESFRVKRHYRGCLLLINVVNPSKGIEGSSFRGGRWKALRWGIDSRKGSRGKLNGEDQSRYGLICTVLVPDSSQVRIR